MIGLNEASPGWNQRFGFDKRGWDYRMAYQIEMRRASPPGLVRRVAPPDLDNPKVQEEVDEQKRNVLKLMAIGGLAAVAAGGAVGAALQYVQPPMEGLASYPRVQILWADGTPVQISNIDANIDPTTTDAYLFQYPLSGEPNFLLNLDGSYGKPPNALGPTPGGNYIVAYSAICQHLGCVSPFLSFYPEAEAKTCNAASALGNGGAPFMHCVCHGSTYNPYVSQPATNGNPAGGAAILTGPTVNALPQVLLESDSSGNVFAIGEMGVPVKGHFSTLLGGTPGPVPASVSHSVVPPLGSSGSTQRCP